MEKIRNEPQELDMEHAIGEVRDPALKETFARIAEKIRHDDSFVEVAEIKKKIINAPKKEKQHIFAFIPHEMAKVSIFFPMSKKELREDRRLIHELPPIESSWGKVEIKGVKLSIFEEDVFLALMKIAKEKARYVKGQIILEVSIPEISKLLYGHAGYTKGAYERIKRALDHFGLITFRLTLFKEQREIFIAGVIQRYDFTKGADKLKIKFNPDFCAFFMESMLTGINYTVRRLLKKDGSKALMRFLATHRNPGKMHILTVLNAINYNTNQPLYELRRKLKQFITELKGQKILGSKTKLYSDDTIFFDILSSKKVLSSKADY